MAELVIAPFSSTKADMAAVVKSDDDPLFELATDNKFDDAFTDGPVWAIKLPAFA